MNDEHERWAFPFPTRVDETLPPDTIKIEAKETHLVRLDADGGVEFVGGPLDGTKLAGEAS